MYRSYRIPEKTPEIMALGKKVADLLIEAKVPYAKAIDALEAAEDILVILPNGKYFLYYAAGIRQE